MNQYKEFSICFGWDGDKWLIDLGRYGLDTKIYKNGREVKGLTSMKIDMEADKPNTVNMKVRPDPEADNEFDPDDYGYSSLERKVDKIIHSKEEQIGGD